MEKIVQNGFLPPLCIFKYVYVKHKRKNTVTTTYRVIRDLSRFFDQVGHRTTNASIENKHFFTK